ncbi:MAG: Ferritin [Lentisphaerae bacterium ADurb.Bin242]|nr:MAG: Ferritin [Lentisphaerae bacterium ADurb.Bin242]
MISHELAKGINQQMVFELYSAYLYLGLSAALEKMNLPGAAHWMKMQADEEISHANGFYTYLVGQDAEIELETIQKPEISADTPLAVFTAALKHEKLVSKKIDKLAELSVKEHSFATLVFLNTFVTEQVEEERNVQVIIDKLSRIRDNPSALLFIDAELAKRTLSPGTAAV